MPTLLKDGKIKHLGSIGYRLNNSFQYLNNITYIFTHFFTHTYFQKIQTMLLKQHYHSELTSFVVVIATYQLAFVHLRWKKLLVHIDFFLKKKKIYK